MLSEQEVINQLRYIADSPSQKYGGFHPNAVKAAKDAIAYIAQQKEEFQKQKQEMWRDFLSIGQIYTDCSEQEEMIKHKWGIV